MILGLDSGYTVKYSPSPSGTPSAEVVYLTIYPSSHTNTDTISVCVSVSPLLRYKLVKQHLDSLVVEHNVAFIQD